MTNKLLIYHDNCNDGFCCAWLASQVWPDILLHPASYGDDPPDVTGMDVIIADFSYPEIVLLRMHQQACKLVVLDHHKTAQQDLEGLEFCTFDMDKSGAMLLWDYLKRNNLINDDEPPILVQYTQDRDLWKHELNDTHAINAVIRATRKNIEDWNDLAATPDHRLEQAGTGILKYRDRLIEEVMLTQACEIRFESLGDWLSFYVRGAVCVHKDIVSDVGAALAIDRPFSVVWTDFPDGNRVHSLRSEQHGEDVSQIAERFDGGGHKHAAGFTTTIDESPIKILRTLS